MLRDRGAEVTGIDAAEPLIAAARERGPQDIRYETADARDLSFLPEFTFDAAACLLAIQNIHPIQPVCEGVARILKPLGRFVIVMMHPCFRGPKETSWGWDEQKQVQFRRVDRYLLPRKSPIVAHPGKSPDLYTWTFHKPIETYVKSLRNAGLLIDAIEEWPSHKTSTSGPRAAAENVARKEIPMFMAIRAVKVLSPVDSK
jgi:ubiquinone/menaquinone biosynthesis C-methylase UbiE